MSNPLDKIKKLLALSKSNNEHEAATALAQAIRLAAEAGIDIDAIDPEVEPLEERDRSGGAQSRKIEQWRGQLWLKIARIFGCATYHVKTCNGFFGTEYCIRLIGRASDIAVADYVATHLQNELMRLARKEMASVRKRRRISEARLRNSFLLGAVMRVVGMAERMFANEQGAIAQGYELIVKRAAAAEQHLKGLNCSPVKHKNPIDDKAFAAGYATAGAIKLNKAMGAAPDPRKRLEA